MIGRKAGCVRNCEGWACSAAASVDSDRCGRGGGTGGGGRGLRERCGHVAGWEEAKG